MKSISKFFNKLFSGNPEQQGEAMGTLLVYGLIGFAIFMLIRNELKKRKAKAKLEEKELEEVIEQDEDLSSK